MTIVAQTNLTNAASLLPRAMAAGFVATIVFTLVSYYAAPAITGFPMDVAAYFTDQFGGNGMLGAMLHYISGTVLFPVGYLLVGPFLPGASWLRGLVWGAIVWLGAMLVVFPVTGAGFFMLGMVGMNAVAAALIDHLIYGVTLGLLLPIGAAGH